MKCSNIKERLIRKAMKSWCEFKIAAIGLSARGETLAIACNRPRFLRQGGGVHAEMAVMLSAPRNLRTIVIVRVNKKGELLPVKPCKACARKARDRGVKILTI